MTLSLDEQPEGLVSAAPGGQPAKPHPQHRQEKLCRRPAFQSDFKCKESGINKHSHTVMLSVHLKAISGYSPAMTWMSMLNLETCLHLDRHVPLMSLCTPALQVTVEPAGRMHSHNPNGSSVFPQSNAVSSTLADLRVALQDVSGELRQERQGSQELTQQFAKAKASWEVERTELKSVITQVRSRDVSRT